MNAAARLVHQNTLTQPFIFSQLFGGQQIVTWVLTIMMLISALGVVYITHLTRTVYAGYQHQIGEQNRLQAEHSQLLLAHSTWMMQARVQEAAETKYNMIVPDHKSVVVVRL